MNYAWHFLRMKGGRPVLRDGKPAPKVGQWLEVAPPLNICHVGLHASWRALDALDFVSWENAAACLVEVDGIGEEHAEKFVCSRRRIVAWVACDDVLRLFAREAALSVAQFWTMPPIVREFLETGDETKRDAARDAARAAAQDAAWAARDAAQDAARAARDAAQDAARAAAWAAAWATAWAARDAAQYAAARDAARAARDAAARDAAWAARAAARADLNALLESLLLGAMEQEGGAL